MRISDWSSDVCSSDLGPLHNPADRDHCIQYMVAVATLFGRLTARDYEDDVAADPRIDALRAKMVCVEEPQFTRSEEHTSELQSLMRISYAVFCLKKKQPDNTPNN